MSTYDAHVVTSRLVSSLPDSIKWQLPGLCPDCSTPIASATMVRVVEFANDGRRVRWAITCPNKHQLLEKIAP